MTLLIPLGALGIRYIGPISAIIIVLLVIVYLSYRQTIAAYPTGGGSYTVARRNLGVFPGLLATAALLLDYVLVVAVGISAGVGALVSAVPALQPQTLWICLGVLTLIAIVKMSQKGLRFALKLSPDIFVVQIRTAEKGEDDLTRRWRDYVERPTRDAGLATPHLVEVPSPYRHVFNPLIDYVLGMKSQHPDRQIAVLIPELVARRWYHHLLHNKRAAMLKALLLVRGDEDIVVINVPWYLTA